jgi:hypothetical protein
LAKTRIVTLLSDFGLHDPYVAEMKAVLLSTANDVSIVDITHDIPKFSVRTGAFVLASSFSYFPPGTVHVAVVDPGVGSGRRAVAVRGSRYFFVGPDNGLLMPAVRMDRPFQIREITNARFTRPTVSSTFHGRDVFAVTAGMLLKGESFRSVGTVVLDPAEAAFPQPRAVEGGFDCEVVHVDGFGNAVTSIHESRLRESEIKPGAIVGVSVGRARIRIPFERTYSDVGKGRLVALIGSHDFLEFSMNQGNAARKLRIKPGSMIRISFGT